MIGGLYHSGGEPMHALTLRLDDVGQEEVAALVSELMPFDDDAGITITVQPNGLRAVFRATLTEQRALDLVRLVFEARRAREAAAVGAES
jgi:hypothetical protein